MRRLLFAILCAAFAPAPVPAAAITVSPSETALLHVECASDGNAAVAALPGLEAPVDAPATVY
ncbi:MAG TPA: hypothetical protein VNR42_07970 [Solirubrobacteraceae bacterium]|jgi:hypothetical protein|nr:hypothetical protein [Solirubrobacteraceae bacterium]